MLAGRLPPTYLKTEKVYDLVMTRIIMLLPLHCFQFHNFPHNFSQNLCFPIWVWHISPGHLTLTHSQLWHSAPGKRHRSIAPKEILSANFIIRSGVYLGSKALLGPYGESDEVLGRMRGLTGRNTIPPSSSSSVLSKAFGFLSPSFTPLPYTPRP